MCLRSVHLLLSFRFRFGFRTSNRFLSLHYVCFISPTSAPHSTSGSVTPCHKIHAVIPFRSTVAYPPTLKTLQTLQDLQPSTHKSNQLNSIAFPNALCHSVPSPPMLFSNAFFPLSFRRGGRGEVYIFFPCDELAPGELIA